MKNHSDIFFEKSIRALFEKGGTIVDIGGGLRIDPLRNNRAQENAWLLPLMEKADYKVLDKVPDYHPDIVGDIHHLPFAENSIDAFICISVLEHVEEPQKAVNEIHRCLKPGGLCYLYAPFLYYYHPERGYYKDFYRFTRDGMEYLVRNFSAVDISNTRGAITTALNLFPFLSKKTGPFTWLDRLFGKEASDQTSGYHALCTK